MKKSLLSLALVAVATSATLVQADNRKGFYAGGGISVMDTGIKSDRVPWAGNPEVQYPTPNLTLTQIDVLGGYKYSPWLGAEARLGTGIKDNQNTNYEYALKYYASLYWRPEVTNQHAKLYGLLGYSSVGVDVTARADDTVISSDSYSGLSIGWGAGFTLSHKSNFNIEFKRLVESSDDALKMSGISLIYDYRF
ncbi:porin family protein [Agaribacterium haliotis]|uniref:porin family protein n=1 Tax=Agaribacterium haliotis TaxID=2013869 RepID=UPI000BB53983|nr:porin family protein [Agaribacterium haliotis]